MKHALVTGAAGFIGSHVVDRLLSEGWVVTALDNFDPFYDRTIKERNVAPHLDHRTYTLIRGDLRDADGMRRTLVGDYEVIIHLAAKAGVRPSIAAPAEYQEVNVTGTQHLLELARTRGVRQFVFASSSSVYGVNPNVPWREDDYVLKPIKSAPTPAPRSAGNCSGTCTATSTALASWL